MISIFVALIVITILLSKDSGKDTKNFSLESKFKDSTIDFTQKSNDKLKHQANNPSENKTAKTVLVPIKVSIQLSQKSSGYSSLFLDGKKLEVLPESTTYNPRIEVKNYTGKGVILIVTKTGDSCWTSLPSKNSSTSLRVVPNCL